MSETSVPAPPSTVARPVSEALLNEKWDRCISNMIIKSTLGLGFGVVFSVLLFRRRAWPAFVGVGFGAGRAYEECNWNLKQASQELKKRA
ncbi:Mitochondrial inner membrane organizing system component [Parahypoxylon ruwenzoriense]